MIVTNIKDFETNVRKYLDEAAKENIVIEYGDKDFIIMSGDSLECALISAVHAGEKRAKEKQ